MSHTRGKLNSSLMFISPEMVKHRSLLALRRREQLRKQKSFLSFEEMGMTASRRRLPSTKKESGSSEKRLPWLGIGFQNSKLRLEKPRVTVSRPKKPRLPPPPVTFQTKDVQVSFSPESSVRLLVNTETDSVPISDLQVTDYSLPTPTANQVRGSEDKSPFGFCVGGEERKLHKAQAQNCSDRPSAVTFASLSLDISSGLENSRKTDTELIRKLHKAAHSSPSSHCVIPPSSLSPGFPSSPRSKTALSLSRIFRQAEKAVAEHSEVPFIPLLGQSVIREEEHKVEAVDSLLRRCPPCRVPAKYNAFRRGTKLSRSRV